jgi:DNA repair exonuclease SbcCD ATPase subunit
MIIFKVLRWKNFLSTGNNWSEVDLTKYDTTLVVGHNGAGKSTLLDALSFALFGKAHRSISKAQLVNSINGKGTVVEISFNVNNSDFKVVRGIKPNTFEIWRDGTLMNQSSHAKEYQKILEQNILKLNHKSFHQIVVLGSSSFIPFMQLTAQNRRDVIEDLLDINVFSKMNGLLKEKISALKERSKDVDHEIHLVQTKMDSQKKYIRSIKALNKEQLEAKHQTISDYRDEMGELTTANIKLSTYLDDNREIATTQKEDVDKKIKDLNKFKTKFDTEIKKIVRDVRFFEQNDTCPSCDQAIAEDTKDHHIRDGKEKAKTIQESYDNAEKALDRRSTELEEVNEILKSCQEVQSNLHSNNVLIGQYQNSIDRTLEEIENIGKAADLEQADQDLDDLTSSKNDLIESRLEISEQVNYNTVMSTMLKDTGIKTKIVKQYLPVINNLVNQFLQTLDFFVSFNLDEAFQETIRSRFRDSFSYASFSEGEKQRIDLALLFTWRQIAKMKNSVATNLLILDETFDSSLDHDGVDNLMKIIYTLGNDTNVFVISHKGEMLDGKFANKIEVYKEKNFSKIKGN